MQTRKYSLLQALDIPLWLKRPDKENTKLTPSSLINSSFSCASLEELALEVKQCQRCPLHQGRTQTVFGVGNKRAKLMLIGEAPGFHEDQQGEPFVGRAGQLLNAMLKSIGLVREDIYIANVLKCRPPNNRDPLLSEVEECTPYLKQQIDLVQPQVLCALGRVAGQYLLATTDNMSQLRGKLHSFGQNQRPLLITYHPAYLLRNPVAKREAYHDLLRLQTLIK